MSSGIANQFQFSGAAKPPHAYDSASGLAVEATQSWLRLRKNTNQMQVRKKLDVSALSQLLNRRQTKNYSQFPASTEKNPPSSFTLREKPSDARKWSQEVRKQKKTQAKTFMGTWKGALGG